MTKQRALVAKFDCQRCGSLVSVFADTLSQEECPFVTCPTCDAQIEWKEDRDGKKKAS